MLRRVAEVVGHDRERAHRERAESGDLGRHGGERGSRRRQLRQIGEVLDDRDAGREQLGVCRPLAADRVVDVERVDADQRGAGLDQGVDGRLGQVRMRVREVLVAPPVPATNRCRTARRDPRDPMSPIASGSIAARRPTARGSPSPAGRRSARDRDRSGRGRRRTDGTACRDTCRCSCTARPMPMWNSVPSAYRDRLSSRDSTVAGTRAGQTRVGLHAVGDVVTEVDVARHAPTVGHSTVRTCHSSGNSSTASICFR